MNNLKFWFLLISLLAVHAVVHAQSYTFMHLGQKDGLSQSAINDIYQDELGMMWFATRGGLDRYDGNSVKVYHPVMSDSSYFPKVSKIDAIHGDNKGFLYLRAHGKFISFDMRTETFRTIAQNGVMASGNGKRGIWVAVRDKIYLLDSEKKELNLVYTLKEATRIATIHEDSNQVCWISTQDQLFSLDNNNTLKRYFSDRHVRKIEEDKRGNLWFITSKGLVKRSPDGALKYFEQEKNTSASLIYDDIRASCIDQDGYLWIGSRLGLCRMNLDTEEVEVFNAIYGREYGLNSQSVMCLFADRQGTVWIGTFFKGVNYINPVRQPFTFHYERNERSFPVVGKFEEDERGVVWVCTEGGGLCSYDPRTKTFESYDKDNNGLDALNYKAILYDKGKDCLWLTSISSSITRFDLKTKKAIVYKSDDEGYFSSTVSIVALGDKLLLGGQYGLVVFDPETGRIQSFPDEETSLGTWINSMVLDSYNRLWVATSYDGLKCYDLKTHVLTSFEYLPGKPNGLSLNEVNVVFEDSKQQIWVGTKGGGLNLYHPESNDFNLITKENNGLLDNNIVALSETNSGLILIGTAQGLSTFSPDEYIFRNYDYTRGFPLEGVNTGSIYVSEVGEIYVGGVDGMTVFTEKELRSVPLQPFDIQFSALFVNNTEVVQGDKTGILEESMPFTKKIQLRHGYSVFSIEFATDNYVRSQYSDVEYRLQGYDTKWMTSQFGRMLSYTNLSPGKYVLELRPKDFPNRVQTLSIEILPPFYLTWYAFLLYTVLSFAIVFGLVRQARIRFFLRTSLEFEQKEKMRNEELIQSKLRFFTNVSHEFRTPVTLIMGQADLLLRSYTIHPVVYSKILNIYKNANNLKGLITELLDFQKQEQGSLKLKVSNVDLIPFLEEIYLTFKEYALNKKIEFEWICSESEISLWIDMDQIQKVVNNLLSNAFKYTSPGNKVQLIVRDAEGATELIVADNGIGIAPDALPHIFDRFYQVNTVDANVGTGIGLALAKGIVDAHQATLSVESTPGEGTTFIVRLKKGNEHFDKSVLLEEIPVRDVVRLQEAVIDHQEWDEAELNQNQEDLPVLLIVEDNKELRNILVESFNKLYQIVEAVDGQQGWEIVQEKSPDIVISDIMMPRMTGIELCMKIKNGIETCHIPVILLTAKTAVEHKFEGLRKGADDYVTKPFDIKLLVARCNNLINNRKMLQKKYLENKGSYVPQVATNASDQELLNKATGLVLSQLQNDRFDIDWFAQEMNLGRTTFFNKLKAITGLTPNQFVMNIRLKKAAELLSERADMNISDVAYAVGFTSPYYFSRCFKEQYSMTPGEYKKKKV